MADRAQPDGSVGGSSIDAPGVTQTHSDSPRERFVERDIERYARRLDADGYVVMRGVVAREPLELLNETMCRAYDRQKEAGMLFAPEGP